VDSIDEHTDDAAIIEHQKQQTSKVEAQQEGDNGSHELQLANPTTLIES